jgi:hypothetical protein
MADQLLVEMKAVLDDFAVHPPERSLAGVGASQHDHSGR